MKTGTKTLCIFIVFVHVFLAVGCAGGAGVEYNSFRPGEIWKDNNGVYINAHGGGLLTYEDKYYWFGEHKTRGRRGNKANVGVHCYSSSDLYNWKDEGIALKVSEDPESDIVKGCVLERPKVIYNEKTNKFVMWFHLERIGKGYSAARAGVAVSDKVTGPYTFIESFRPNAGCWPINVTEEQKIPPKGEYKDRKFSGAPDRDINKAKVLARDFAGGQMSRDMTLFVDNDGKAYHIYASEENGTLQISQLTDDYLSYAGKYARAFQNRWMEAPAVCKRNGKYYLIMSGCTGWAPNMARSAVSDSILGPWKELDNPCVGDGSDKTFGGQSTYILKVAGKDDDYIAMFDLWRPRNAIDGRYMWLPIDFMGEGITIKHLQEWDLTYFK
jgi:hypothetical protein